MRSALIILTVLLIFGCGSLFKESSKKTKYFVLKPPNCTANEKEAINSMSLLVKDITQNSFINSHKIIFQDSEFSLGHYQYASWVEPPPKQLISLVVERLECEKLFKNIAPRTSYVTSDYILTLEVVDFYHDITSSPNKIRIHIRAEFADRNERKIISKRVFERDIPVKEENIDAALTAFNLGVGEILDDMAIWLRESQ